MSDAMAALLLLVVGLAAIRGTRRLLRGLDRAVPLEIVRGVRDCAIALAAASSALAILCARPGFFVVGALVLAEELYETAVLAVVIRTEHDAGVSPRASVSARRSTRLPAR